MLLKAMGDEGVRVQAHNTLLSIPADARWAVPALLKALAHSDPFVRDCAAGALSRMAIDDPRAVPALIRALHDPGLGIRLTAARLLGSLGPAAHTALPALSEAAQKDESEYVRQAAEDALQEVGGSR
jgi:HEAT repeat protein